MQGLPESLGQESWDPLHVSGNAEHFWSTDNIGEALPGVLSPLGWTFTATTNNTMLREVGYRIGALTRAERTPLPGPETNFVSIFYGRIAMRADYLASLGDRVPGTTGAQAVEAVLGRVPEEMTFSPTRRRYPVIAMRLPRVFMTQPAELVRLNRVTDVWWRKHISDVDRLDMSDARALLVESRNQYDLTMTNHALGLFAIIDPMYKAVAALVAKTGTGDVGTLSGTGGAEMAIVSDLWKAANGKSTLDVVVANHGFHGPREGEISSRVWRENDSQLRRLLDDYADQPDPTERERESQARLPRMRRELLRKLPAVQRLPAEALLRLAAKRVPMRGLTKRSYVQSIDVGRAAVRTLGRHLSSARLLEDPEDVFYLTYNEIVGDMPSNAKELVDLRRERSALYRSLVIPTRWRGTPIPRRSSEATDEERPRAVSGIGVSDGLAVGPVRVIEDIAEDDVEPGDILVAPTTDPSWASVMYVCSALIVDIGGPLSHAAVVARELGIPCVVNTRTGTRDLRTGDQVRVDGRAGTIERIDTDESSPRAVCS